MINDFIIQSNADSLIVDSSLHIFFIDEPVNIRNLEGIEIVVNKAGLNIVIEMEIGVYISGAYLKWADDIGDHFDIGFWGYEIGDNDSHAARNLYATHKSASCAISPSDVDSPEEHIVCEIEKVVFGLVDELEQQDAVLGLHLKSTELLLLETFAHLLRLHQVGLVRVALLEGFDEHFEKTGPFHLAYFVLLLHVDGREQEVDLARDHPSITEQLLETLHVQKVDLA